jgi:hypothetical protein
MHFQDKKLEIQNMKIVTKRETKFQEQVYENYSITGLNKKIGHTESSPM